MVRQSGDKDRGTILVALTDLQGQGLIYRQERDLDFELVWKPYPFPERELEREIQKALKGDPDQWVIEIEDRNMRFPF